MNSRCTSRIRLALVLALAVVMSSDSAMAVLVCNRVMAMGCHSSSSSPDQPASSSETDAEVQAMPCCPGSAAVTMQCSDPAMDCCTLEQGGRESAVVVSKSNTIPIKPLALLLSAAVSNHSAASARLIRDFDDGTSAYVKPVNQKKTDLRV
jgi:hypothetical protein